MNTYTKKA